ncbi:hypothetical protein CYMTET_30281 [Cymbomonas tetramitiformis]|uniref:Nucleolar complex protein 2 homolog n=1 Tax=Cymbomonas tetramitiformis TaxID=36881 RepID=A0AAE0FKQ7_9CHLO|nr:hypothetical protein CYMTET_30281 [Cymbomonas tetramitiformis]
MGKKTKATKKFQKNHLTSSIEKRRAGKKLNDYKKARHAPKSGHKAAEDEEPTHEKKAIEDMDADEFMNAQFGDDDDEDEDDDPEEEEEDLLKADDDEEKDGDQEFELGEEDESEEDDEMPEGSLRADNAALRNELGSHKDQLKSLEEQDPEFFKYLQENDQDLLNWDESDEEEEDPATEAAPGAGTEDAMEEEEASEPARAGKERGVLTTKMVTEWCKAAKENRDIASVKKLLRGYRSACHYGDAQLDDLDSEYNIASSNVFNKLMLFVLREIDGIFRSILGMAGKDPALTSNVSLEKRPRWKKVEPLLKSYLGNTLHIAGQMTDDSMIAFTLRRLGASADLMEPFDRLTRKILRMALGVFAGGDSVDNARLRVSAILFIRRLAVAVPGYLDKCLRGVYRTFAANAKFVTPTSIPSISFMADCVVEMYGLDHAASYQHAFVAIRQLALLLRSALTTKTKDAFQAIYCWQAVWCMEVWVRVLVAYTESVELQALVYPVAQIIVGAARLLPAARYFPLRLRLVRLLNRLAAGTGKFIPVSSLLIEVLQFKELSKSPLAAGGAGKPPDFATVLKVPKASLRTTAFQGECMSQALWLLAEHLSHWGYSPSFPELTHVPIVALRAFVKKTSVDRFRKQAKSLVEVVERHSDWVVGKRNTVDFAPRDTMAIGSFMEAEKQAKQGPLYKYVAQLRAEAERQQKALRASTVAVDDPGASKAPAPKVPKFGTGQAGTMDGDEDEEDAEEDNENGDEAFGTDWMPSAEEKRKADLKAKKKKLAGAAKSRAEAEDQDGGADDEVEDFVMSDDEDEDEDEDAPQLPPPKKGGKAGSANGANKKGKKSKK